MGSLGSKGAGGAERGILTSVGSTIQSWDGSTPYRAKSGEEMRARNSDEVCCPPLVCPCLCACASFLLEANKVASHLRMCEATVIDLRVSLLQLLLQVHAPEQGHQVRPRQWSRLGVREDGLLGLGLPCQPACSPLSQSPLYGVAPARCSLACSTFIFPSPVSTAKPQAPKSSLPLCSLGHSATPCPCPLLSALGSSQPAIDSPGRRASSQLGGIVQWLEWAISFPWPSARLLSVTAAYHSPPPRSTSVLISPTFSLPYRSSPFSLLPSLCTPNPSCRRSVRSWLLSVCHCRKHRFRRLEDPLPCWPGQCIFGLISLHLPFRQRFSLPLSPLCRPLAIPFDPPVRRERAVACCREQLTTPATAAPFDRLSLD